MELLDRKSDDETEQLVLRIGLLSEKLDAAINHETPLVGALTLLVAIRRYDEVLTKNAN